LLPEGENAMGPRVRIGLVSDDRLFLEGVLRIIAAEPTFTVVSHNCSVAVQSVLRAACHVVLVDSRVENAIGLCAALKSDSRPLIIMLAAPEDESWAREALSAGARGILGRIEDLVKAVRVVHEGQMWVRRQFLTDWLEHLLGAASTPAGFERQLSCREREVVRCAVAGLGNKEVADRLMISEATVKVHLTHIFRKLGVHGRGQLAAAYHGLISLSAHERSNLGSVTPTAQTNPSHIPSSAAVVRLKA
jgi:DNA-binding NarL/FixJ family response regulator